jgi:AraC-like DNA-binding protein
MPKTHNIDWLINEDLNESSAIGSNPNGSKVAFPYKAKMASGYTEHLPILDGIVLIRDSHKFLKNSCPPTISLGKFAVQFEAPMFSLNILHSGNIEAYSHNHSKKLLREPGLDLFGRLHGYEVSQTVHTKENITATTLIIPEATMQDYLGEEGSEMLYQNLGLSSQDSLNLFPVSKLISDPLMHCLPDNLEHKMRVLYAQSKIIQYLIDLNIHTASSGRFLKRPEKKICSIHELHELLEKSKGEIPTLSSLSKEFGVSPAKLNNDFRIAYGESIYSFISNLRLYQAQKALTDSNIPMKTIADKIGYSHVNHFIYAFKKKFGITPGAHRKNHQKINLGAN